MFTEKFTRTENKVLSALKDDNFATDQQIADRLSVSINTVRTHLKNMYKKQGISGHNCRFRLSRKG